MLFASDTLYFVLAKAENNNMSHIMCFFHNQVNTIS